MSARIQRITLDDAANEFFERELETVKAKTYDVKYPTLMARQLIPVSHDADSGDETITYRQFDHVGMAKLLASYADDLPRADVLGKEFHQSIKPIGASYGYSIQEIRAAMKTGRPLAQRKADAARRACEEKLDALAAAGDSDNGLNGLLALDNTNSYTVAQGASTYYNWARKTPMERLADLNGVFQKSISETNGVERGDTILIPEDQMSLINDVPLQAGSDTTVLDFFKSAHPGVRVLAWYKCKGAGDSGKDRMVCYRAAPDALTLEMPQEFEQFPDQPRGLEFVVSCHMRTGGVICYYPMSVTYGDGI